MLGKTEAKIPIVITKIREDVTSMAISISFTDAKSRTTEPLTPRRSQVNATKVRHILTAKSLISIGSVASAIAAAIRPPAELLIRDNPER